MADLDFGKIRGRTTSFLDGFTTGQKVITVLAVAGLAMGAFWFSKWTSEPTYAPLYSNLQGADAAAVTDSLQQQGVPFKLSDGGSTILVPQNQVYSARIKLSQKNLPAGGGGDGFSLIDKQGITTSEFNQRIDYQRALQTELEKTIEAMNGVQGSSVIITTPKSDVFTTGSSKMTASVMITPANGQALKSGQVQAIVHLVAASVPDLAPENVTVADSNGRVLSADGATGGADDNQQATADYQRQKSDEITTQLSSVTGPDAAVVRVAATLNFDQRSATSEMPQLPTPTTTPGQTATSLPPMQQSTSSETYSGQGSGGAGGTLGTGTAGGGTTGGPTSYSKNSDSVTNPYGKVTEMTKFASGQPTRMSVSVLLDANKVADGDITKIEQMVTAAAGLDTARGDTLQVTRLPFDKTVATEAKKQQAAAASTESQSSMMKMIQTALAVLLVLAVLFVAWRMLKKSASRRPTARVGLDIRRLEQEAMERIAAAEQEQYLKALESNMGMAAGRLGPGIKPESDAARQSQDIAEMIDRQPEEVAMTIRGWMADRR